ncbi:hypothetical protein HDU96_003014 [Phlyctochytrium bullatum]|nr:hypothetical protein HDU96_003014 [Phlyctochytrium bullatum]
MGEPLCGPEVEGAGTVFMGLGRPTLPLDACARLGLHKVPRDIPGIDSWLWDEAFAVSVVKHPEGNANCKIVFSDLEAVGTIRQTSADLFANVDGPPADVSCVASNDNGLIAFGAKNGRVFLASILAPSDLLAAVSGWESAPAAGGAREASAAASGRKRRREEDSDDTEAGGSTSSKKSKP